jgi:hypothetical protein
VGIDVMTAATRTGRSPEHNELADVVGSFLAERCPESEVRRLMATDTGFDAPLWRRMATSSTCRA